MLSLRAFLNDRLMAVADEIFGAVEKTIAEYKEEIFRSKDLEITRLRMQLKLLKSEPELERCIEAQLQQHTHHHHHHPPPQHHQSNPAVEEAPEPQHCEEDEGSSMEQEHPEPSQVKKEQQQQKSHRDFWMGQDATEQLDSLESDIKDFISSPSSLRNSLQDPILPFHPNHNNNNNNGSAGEKPYCCSVCEKRFSNCSHLAAHIRTHTGERPYICEICRKTFITTSALNRHQTIHTEGKHFICNYCGKSFKWMESLGRHIRSLHKRENMPV
ncbi:zinc finger and SCAN domain-containing protein 32-like [Notolabrus celidotus]|uniref:zinc finger and SCAN domain-containing protein 32-like n=1 Tax=Notolabrus celidotus TaxID=1203425 RepID=UPI00148FA85A|nr:zinc finger and SCAN domain-containing protein 32-like [Notolabrus celidotus]